MTHEDFLMEACIEAQKGMRSDHGGPFGAIVVRNGEIIGRGHNMVTSTNDPTAYAEIIAIRKACSNLSRFHLEETILYASCEPCPMCLAAIYWANIKEVYFSSDKNDAEHIGFNDKFIYDELRLPVKKRNLQMKKISLDIADEIFDEWMTKQDKIKY